MECSNINRFRPHYFMTDISEGCIKSIFSYISLLPLNSLRYLVVFISHIIYCTATDIESKIRFIEICILLLLYFLRLQIQNQYILQITYTNYAYTNYAYTIFSTLTRPSNTQMMSLT